MKNIAHVKEEIYLVAQDIFESDHVESFISQVQNLLADEPMIDCILQVSTDEGDELEVGFFTNTRIADVTLSKGKVYFYAYPISTIQTAAIADAGAKWTLTIVGEKKFDYNIVKPASPSALSRYEQSIRAQLSALHLEIK